MPLALLFIDLDKIIPAAKPNSLFILAAIFVQPATWALDLPLVAIVAPISFINPFKSAFVPAVRYSLAAVIVTIGLSLPIKPVTISFFPSLLKVHQILRPACTAVILLGVVCYGNTPRSIVAVAPGRMQDHHPVP